MHRPVANERAILAAPLVSISFAIAIAIAALDRSVFPRPSEHRDRPTSAFSFKEGKRRTTVHLLDGCGGGKKDGAWEETQTERVLLLRQELTIFHSQEGQGSVFDQH